MYAIPNRSTLNSQNQGQSLKPTINQQNLRLIKNAKKTTTKRKQKDLSSSSKSQPQRRN